jgi:predicted RNase H-like HicB family nuclease
MPEKTPLAPTVNPVSESASNGTHPVTVVVKVQIQALAVAEPKGGYSVIVPALPGCVTEGDDIEDVQANIVEAVEGWLAVAHDRNKDEALKLVLE